MKRMISLVLLLVAVTCMGAVQNSGTVIVVDPSSGGTAQDLADLGEWPAGYLVWSNTAGFRIKSVDLNGNTDSVYWPSPGTSVMIPSNIGELYVAHTDTVFIKVLY